LIKAVLAAASAYGAEMCEEKEPSWKVGQGCRVDSRPEYGKEVMDISVMRKKKSSRGYFLGSTRMASTTGVWDKFHTWYTVYRTFASSQGGMK
jgi:hypothetical protein